MKKIIKSIIILINKLFYPKFNHNDSNYSLYEIFKFGIMQKIFGFNRNVPWPVHFSSVVSNPNKITRGNKCPGYAIGCYLNGANGIEFGDNVWTGPRVTIASSNHNLTNFTKYKITKSIKIGKNSWLGANCVILAGVELGEHTIVAAGAIVTKSFTKNNIVIAGNPAKIIKEIDPYEIY